MSGNWHAWAKLSVTAAAKCPTLYVEIPPVASQLKCVARDGCVARFFFFLSF